MTSQKYNDRLFYLIEHNALYPLMPLGDVENLAKARVIWAKALIEAYEGARRPEPIAPDFGGKRPLEGWEMTTQSKATPRLPDRGQFDLEAITRCDCGGCLNACFAIAPELLNAQGWHQSIAGLFFCPACWKTIGPEPGPGPALDVNTEPEQPCAPLDSATYEHIANVFKQEMKEFLERASKKTVSGSNKSIFQFLLRCIEPDPPHTTDNPTDVF